MKIIAALPCFFLFFSQFAFSQNITVKQPTLEQGVSLELLYPFPILEIGAKLDAPIAARFKASYVLVGAMAGVELATDRPKGINFYTSYSVRWIWTSLISTGDLGIAFATPMDRVAIKIGVSHGRVESQVGSRVKIETKTYPNISLVFRPLN